MNKHAQNFKHNHVRSRLILSGGCSAKKIIMKKIGRTLYLSHLDLILTMEQPTEAWSMFCE